MVLTFRLLDLTQDECRNRVERFFRHEGDAMPYPPMLIEFERWGQCDEVIVAEDPLVLKKQVVIWNGSSSRPERLTIELHTRKQRGNLP